MNEIWKDIPGLNGIYQVSNLSRIRSVLRMTASGRKPETILKQPPDKKGYKRVYPVVNRIVHALYVHRVVAEAFIPKIEGKNNINHKDGDKSNPEINNLEWCTNKENSQHAYRLGLLRHPPRLIGEKCAGARLNALKVKQIKKRLLDKESCASIARDFSVHEGTISCIKRGETWTHI